MTCSIEHTEEEDNDEGGGREEVTNEQLVKVYNVYLCAIPSQFMQLCILGKMSEYIGMAKRKYCHACIKI